jgi:hypothetical protein
MPPFERALIAGVVVVGALGAVLSGVLAYDAQDAAGRDKVQQEVAKLAFQFLVVSVLGVLFKFLIDRYHDRAKRIDTLADYRQEMLRRLVAVTKRVRNVPTIVGAERSARAYNEQMRELLDAHSELGEIRHDIETSSGQGKRNPAFKAWPEIEGSLRAMEKYLRAVVSEWQGSYHDLSELEARAEGWRILQTQERRRELQAQVWEFIRDRPHFKSMLEEPDQEDLPPEGHLQPSKFTARFLYPYHDALRLMRGQTLQQPASQTPEQPESLNSRR